MADTESKIALRNFLASAKKMCGALDPVLGGIFRMLTDLRDKGQVVLTAKSPLLLEVTAPGCPVVLAAGSIRRQKDAVVPCVQFAIDGRPVHVKIVLSGEAWQWADGAGIGVDGQPLTTENTARVLLAMLASEV